MRFAIWIRSELQNDFGGNIINHIKLIQCDSNRIMVAVWKRYIIKSRWNLDPVKWVASLSPSNVSWDTALSNWELAFRVASTCHFPRNCKCHKSSQSSHYDIIVLRQIRVMNTFAGTHGSYSTQTSVPFTTLNKLYTEHYGILTFSMTNPGWTGISLILHLGAENTPENEHGHEYDHKNGTQAYSLGR